MTESAENRAPVPQCCAAATADAGITVNGFHDRKGQPPGLRLLFAEEQYRRRAIAYAPPDVARESMRQAGIESPRLVAKHAAF